ncbi:MAG: hypothetical protein L6265_06095 [Thermoplasmatales archaeon]|nr:hypothetical protein [Candidatus Thermoplasmatota archaeon]MCG2826145.1 hypothetical protein [Thermoplasmatales archaeon]
MKNKIKTIGLIALLFVGMILTVPINVKGDAEGYIPVAKLDIPNNLEYVDVDPASNATAVFSGTLHVSCQSATITEFELSCSQSDWVVAISPASVGLPAGTQTADVTIVVKVPQKTDSDIAGTVRIDGRTRTATPISYSTGFANEVTVMVNKYYVFSVSSSTPYIETNPHTQTIIKVDIENMGNAVVDDLYVTVENKKQLISAGWTIIEPATKLQVSGEQNITVHINVETPMDWTLWTDSPQEIIIKVNSKNAGIDETYSTYIRQKGTYIPGFEPAIMLIALGLIAVMLKKKH